MSTQQGGVEFNSSGNTVIEKDVAGRDIIKNYITPTERPPLWVNVPAMPNHFLGREELMNKVVGQLISGNALAFSAEGLPGVGKTTMAVAVCHHKQLLGHFTDGILWAGVGKEGEPTLLLAQWAEALGGDVSRLEGDEARHTRVRNLIGQRKLLLLIDDVWDKKTAELMRCGGPNCTHLLTTRDKSIARAFAGISGLTNVPTLEDKPAYDLLQALAPEVCAVDPSAVKALIKGAGNLPLACDLLGGYLAQPEYRHFPELSREGMAELADPTKRLALAKKRLGSSRSGKISLAETIELSVSSLPTQAQTTFHALGAFAPKPATFSRKAAEAVTGADGKILSLLIDRNLLTKSEKRLATHQVVGEWAQMKMTGADQERHRAYYVGVANQDREDWRRIAIAYPQLNWAWERAADAPATLDLYWGVRIYLERRGLQGEHMAWAERGLQIAKSHNLRKDESALLNNMAGIYRAQGDYPTALGYLERSLKISQDIGDVAGEGTTLNNIGQIYHAQGDYPTALGYYQRSLKISQDIGDVAGEGTTLNNMAGTAYAQGDYPTALGYLERSLKISQDIGDVAGEGTTLNNIGQIYHAQGDYPTALGYYQQALKISQDIGNVAGEGATLNNISQIYHAQGDYPTALGYYQRSLKIRQDIGDVAGLCATLFNMGHIHWENEKEKEAIEAWVEVYRLAQPRGIANVLQALAGLAGGLGLPGDGLAAWQALSEQMGDS